MPVPQEQPEGRDVEGPLKARKLTLFNWPLQSSGRSLAVYILA